MQFEPKRPKGREATISALNEAIKAAGLAEKASAIYLAGVVFCSVGTLLTLIRVRFLLFYNNLLQIYT